jgi:DNA-binding CsgD family transcriptional regulator
VFVTSIGRRWRNGHLESTREAVSRLLSEGLTQAEIASALGRTKSTIAYHCRNLDVITDERFARRYDWAAIRRAYDGGMSYGECAARFGFNGASWSKAVRRGDIEPRARAMPLARLLVDGRIQTNRSHLKARLLAEGLKADCCERCGLTEWRGEPLAMQLHHRNGRGKDNRLENLELLCPNCHAQTENWGGRNRPQDREMPAFP